MHEIKKRIFLFLIIFLFSSSSFAVSQYGAWNSFSKLPGLQYAVKCNGYNKYANKYDWSVKFYNGYTKTISFSTIPTQPGLSSPPSIGWGRLKIKSGNTYGGGWNLVANAPCNGQLTVWYDKVRFGDSDSGPYYGEQTPTTPTTTWLSASDYQNFFNNQVDRGYYPDNIKGTCSNGVSVFTSQWKPLSSINYFYSNHNITQSVYTQNNAAHIAAGLRLTSVNTFTDCSGVIRYQATWIK